MANINQNRLPSIKPALTDAYKRVKPLTTEKNTAYLMAIFSFLTLSFFGLFAIRPTILTAFTLYKEIQDLKVLNQQYEDKITNVVVAQSEYERIRNDIPLIYETLPETPQFPKLISTIENLATSSSLILEDMQIDPQPIAPLLNTKELTDYSVQLRLSGEYQNAYTFLSNLVNNQRLISIKSLDLKTEESTSSGELTVNFMLQSYYEP